MRDCNYSLQKAYLLALSGIIYDGVAVPVYYQNLPDNISPDNYIIFGPVTNTDGSTFNSSDTNTLMRVTAHTASSKYNSGKAASYLGNEILQRLYATPQFVLPLTDNLQMVSTSLVSDNTLDYKIINSQSFLDRIFIFRHIIFQR